MKPVRVAPEPVLIDKNIPLPERVTRRGRPSRYPWKDMDITDSFLFPKDIALAACRTMAWDAGRKLKRKFAVLTTSEGNRCWRMTDPEPKLEAQDENSMERGV